jgi:hypothetical protein
MLAFFSVSFAEIGCSVSTNGHPHRFSLSQYMMHELDGNLPLRRLPSKSCSAEKASSSSLFAPGFWDVLGMQLVEDLCFGWPCVGEVDVAQH